MIRGKFNIRIINAELPALEFNISDSSMNLIEKPAKGGIPATPINANTRTYISTVDLFRAGDLKFISFWLFKLIILVKDIKLKRDSE